LNIEIDFDRKEGNWLWLYVGVNRPTLMCRGLVASRGIAYAGLPVREERCDCDVFGHWVDLPADRAMLFYDHMDGTSNLFMK
jgi:hypothetical protein